MGGEDDDLQPSDESTFSPHKTSCRTLKFSADGSGMSGWAYYTQSITPHIAAAPRLSLSLSGCFL